MKRLALYLLLALLPSLALAQKKEKIYAQKIAAINQTSESLFLLKDLQLLHEQAYTAMLAWVYTYGGPDEVTKKQITKSFSDVQARCNKHMPAWNHAPDQQLLQSILDNMQLMMQYYQEISEQLASMKDYEDPMIKFMAEETLSGSVDLLKQANDSLFAQLTKSRQLKLTFLQNNLNSKENRKEKFQNIEKLLSMTIKVEPYFLMNLQQNHPGREKLTSSTMLLLQQRLISELIPVYDARFSNEEIKKILKFHQSELGKKLKEEQVDIQLESLQILKKCLEEFTSAKED